MAMTVAEKIIARHAGLERVEPGQIVSARVDLAMGNDVTTPVAVERFREMGAGRVFDPEKVAIVLSHFVPAKDIPSSQLARVCREFAREQRIRWFFEVGKGGIEHVLLPEMGLVAPGDLVIGADSHSCTYGALGAFATGVGSTDLAAVLALGEIWLRVPETLRVVWRGRPGPWVMGKDMALALIAKIGDDGARYMCVEHVGEGVEALSMDSRLTLSNMAIEAGAKAGIIPADSRTLEYVAERQRASGLEREVEPVVSDPDATFAGVVELDLSELGPQVAAPFLPSNSGPVQQLAGTPVDQVFIGSCTNGKLEDLRVAAAVLKGRKVHPSIRCIVIPATQRVFQRALEEGLIAIFLEAGCQVEGPTCGPCLGGYAGVLGPGERCLSTSNRNYRGRMGHPEAEVYLANPAVAAATAVAGQIVHPDDVLS